VFHCAHEACPPGKKGQAYCTSCCEVGKHPFPHKKIIRFLNEYVWDCWTDLNTSLTELSKKATAEYQKYKQLIIYFEQELLLRPIQPGDDAPLRRIISADVEKISQEAKKVAYFVSRK
jgi:hypothetical protein